MRRKDGEVRSDYDFELDDMILALLEEKRILPTNGIRNMLNEIYGRKLDWRTIRRHIDRLLVQKRVRVFLITEGKKRNVTLYKLTR